MNDKEIREAVEILKGLTCLTPNIRQAEYVSRDMAIDAGDLSLEGSIYREGTYEQCGGCEVCLLQQKLLSFLQYYLDIKGFPEEKLVQEKYTGLATGYISELDTKNLGFNKALHLCKLASLKRENEIKERCSVENLQNILANLNHLGCCIYDKDCHENLEAAQAIHKEIVS